MNVIPKSFRKALINGLPLRTNEIILETLYNNKCITSQLLWNRLPNRNEIQYEIKSYEKFDTLLKNFLEKGWIRKDRAIDKPEIKSSGYKVDIEGAYKNLLPYTMMGLDPLPAYDREDFIYHLLMFKGRTLTYQIFQPEKHQYIDRLSSNLVYFFEKYHKELPACFMENVSGYNLQLSQKDIESKLQNELSFEKTEPVITKRIMIK